MSKVYQTTVLDNSAQSRLIMDVTGYSHFGPSRQVLRAGNIYSIRPVFFLNYTNKAKLQAEIKKVLGNSFWPNLNTVEKI